MLMLAVLKVARPALRSGAGYLLIDALFTLRSQSAQAAGQVLCQLAAYAEAAIHPATQQQLQPEGTPMVDASRKLDFSGEACLPAPWVDALLKASRHFHYLYQLPGPRFDMCCVQHLCADHAGVLLALLVLFVNPAAAATPVPAFFMATSNSGLASCGS